MQEVNWIMLIEHITEKSAWLHSYWHEYEYRYPCVGYSKQESACITIEAIHINISTVQVQCVSVGPVFWQSVPASTQGYLFTQHIVWCNFDITSLLRHSKYYTKLLTATEIQVLVIVQVTVNIPLIPGILIRVTHTSINRSYGWWHAVRQFKATKRRHGQHLWLGREWKLVKICFEAAFKTR